MKEIIHTSLAPKPIGPYNQAIKLDNLVFLSGQIPVDPNTGKIEETDIISQTKQVLSNIGAVLDESGSTFSKIIKTTIFLVNMDDFSKFNEIYATYFNDSIAPARSTIQVAALPLNSLIEIEVIAEC